MSETIDTITIIDQMVVEAHVLGLRIIPQRGRLLIQGLLLPRYFPSDEA